jgi:hypothetical protein
VGCGFGIGWGFGGELLLSARLAMLLKVKCIAAARRAVPAWLYCLPGRQLHQFHMQQVITHLCVVCVALLCHAGGSIGFGGLGAGKTDRQLSSSSSSFAAAHPHPALQQVYKSTTKWQCSWRHRQQCTAQRQHQQRRQLPIKAQGKAHRQQSCALQQFPVPYTKQLMLPQ